jgi:hypothetical protein
MVWLVDMPESALREISMPGVIYEDVPRGVITVHLQEVDPLLGALLEMIPREFLRAVEA